jgi:transposase
MAKLTEKQEIVLLGLVAGKSRAECAKLAEVSESTIYNWLNDETFRKRLKEAQARVFDETTAQLHGLASLAIESLKRGLDGRAKAAEIRTAIAIFAQTTKLREMELVERIEKLERIFQTR